jgi:hypothetical protein
MKRQRQINILGRSDYTSDQARGDAANRVLTRVYRLIARSDALPQHYRESFSRRQLRHFQLLGLLLQ